MASTSNGSRRATSLFAPFRSLGHVSTAVPFVVHTHSTKDTAVFGDRRRDGEDSGKQNGGGVVVTSVGRGWAMWTLDKMRLLLVGPPTPVPITSLAMHGSGAVLAAAGPAVYIYRRGSLVGQLSSSSSRTAANHAKRVAQASESDNEESSEESEDEESDEDLLPFGNTTNQGALEPIAKIIVFGDQVVGLAASGSAMFVWDFTSHDLRTTISFPPSFGMATSLIHPSTYINKVVVGSSNGSLGIWNIRTAACVHVFPHTLLSPVPSSSLLPSAASTSLTTQTTQPAGAAITALDQSPAIDVLAVGTADGRCALVDVRLGEELVSVRMGGAAFGGVEGEVEGITAIAFRADSQAQILATASTSGSLAFWNLDASCRLLHVLHGAHSAPASGLAFLPSQPILVSSSGDNSLKQWFFEAPLELPRLLSSREGHKEPPRMVRYFGDDGKLLLSAGGDHTLRGVSVVRDSRSFELSQGQRASKKAERLGISSADLRLPLLQSRPGSSHTGDSGQVVGAGMSFSTARSKEWDEVLTAHAGSRIARTWSVESKRLGSHLFDVSTDRKGDRGKGKASLMSASETDASKKTVSCVCVTACGNYGLAAYVDKSSGAATGRVKMWNMQSGILRREFALPTGKRKAEREVTGLETDALNRVLVVATLAGRLHFFDFATAQLAETLQIPSAITTTRFQRNSGLLAVACADHKVRLVDVETKRIIRELTGCRGDVLDLAFSPDSRWLITTSSDSIVRTFDIPTGLLLDAFRTASLATSLTFSPTSDFLATSHLDSLGISLWANRAQFAEVSMRTANGKVDEERVVGLPALEGREDQDAEEVEAFLRPEAWVSVPDESKKEPLELGLVTLSLMPRSKWQTLLNLETIKARNKPKEAPKAPERAPFFIPTVSGAQPRFDLSSQLEADRTETEGKKRKLQLGPGASIESEFTRLLSAEAEDGDYPGFFAYVARLPPSSLDLDIRTLSPTPIFLRSILHALAQRLRSGRDFELCQAVLAVFLRIHGEALIGGGHEVRDSMEECDLALQETGRRVRELVDYGIGVRAFVAGATGVV